MGAAPNESSAAPVHHGLVIALAERAHDRLERLVVAGRVLRHVRAPVPDP
jgi:hypothetical protein